MLRCGPQVRGHLNALAAAHEARCSQQAASATAHTLTLGVLGVGAALDTGAPLGPPLRSLTSAVRAVQGEAQALGTDTGEVNSGCSTARHVVLGTQGGREGSCLPPSSAGRSCGLHHLGTILRGKTSNKHQWGREAVVFV
jgi:hypothetical protein